MPDSPKTFIHNSARMVRLRCLLLLPLLVTCIESFSTGFLPNDACMGGPYGHTTQSGRIKAQTSLPPFKIEVFHATDNSQAIDYTAGERLKVVISSTDSIRFDGFNIWGISVGSSCSVGNWTSGESQRLRPCTFVDPTHTCNVGHKANSLVHQRRQRALTVEGSFTVPHGLTGTLQFRANIVRNYNVFWRDVRSNPIIPAVLTTRPAITINKQAVDTVTGSTNPSLRTTLSSLLQNSTLLQNKTSKTGLLASNITKIAQQTTLSANILNKGTTASTTNIANGAAAENILDATNITTASPTTPPPSQPLGNSVTRILNPTTASSIAVGTQAADPTNTTSGNVAQSGSAAGTTNRTIPALSNTTPGPQTQQTLSSNTLQTAKNVSTVQATNTPSNSSFQPSTNSSTAGLDHTPALRSNTTQPLHNSPVVTTSQPQTNMIDSSTNTSAPSTNASQSATKVVSGATGTPSNTTARPVIESLPNTPPAQTNFPTTNAPHATQQVTNVISHARNTSSNTTLQPAIESLNKTLQAQSNSSTASLAPKANETQPQMTEIIHSTNASSIGQTTNVPSTNVSQQVTNVIGGSTNTSPNTTLQPIGRSQNNTNLPATNAPRANVTQPKTTGMRNSTNNSSNTIIQTAVESQNNSSTVPLGQTTKAPHINTTQRATQNIAHSTNTSSNSTSQPMSKSLNHTLAAETNTSTASVNQTTGSPSTNISPQITNVIGHTRNASSNTTTQQPLNFRTTIVPSNTEQNQSRTTLPPTNTSSHLQANITKGPNTSNMTGKPPAASGNATITTPASGQAMENKTNNISRQLESTTKALFTQISNGTSNITSQPLGSVTTVAVVLPTDSGANVTSHSQINATSSFDQPTDSSASIITSQRPANDTSNVFGLTTRMTTNITSQLETNLTASSTGLQTNVPLHTTPQMNATTGEFGTSNTRTQSPMNGTAGVTAQTEINATTEVSGKMIEGAANTTPSLSTVNFIGTTTAGGSEQITKQPARNLFTNTKPINNDTTSSMTDNTSQTKTNLVLGTPPESTTRRVGVETTQFSHVTDRSSTAKGIVPATTETTRKINEGSSETETTAHPGGSKETHARTTESRDVSSEEMEKPTTRPTTLRPTTIRPTTIRPITTNIPTMKPTTKPPPPLQTKPTNKIITTGLPKVDPANQAKVVTFKLNGNYDELVGPDPVKAIKEIKDQLSKAMKVTRDRIRDLKLTAGSVDVKFTLAPAADEGPTTNDAVADLESFLVDDTQKLKINGKELTMAPGSLKTASVESLKEEEVTGLPLTTKIVLAVVFGLIGIAIIIAIIVICMRQRKSHGFLMMRAARKDYGIPLRTMETNNGRSANGNGTSNGHQGNRNHGFSRA